MKKNKLLLFLTAFVMAFSMIALTGCGDKEEPAEPEEEAVLTWADADVPEDVQAIRDEVLGLAEKGAEELGTDFGDKYVALIESGEARDYAGYDELFDPINAMTEEIGATYVYTMSPLGDDGEPVLDSDGTGSFCITVDGDAEEPDDWATDYGWEIQFTEAWEGAPAAARSAWADSDELICWSAFAPILDSEGNVVCILGIDYPANVIFDYPEWNRDADEWNGIEE